MGPLGFFGDVTIFQKDFTFLESLLCALQDEVNIMSLALLRACNIIRNL